MLGVTSVRHPAFVANREYPGASVARRTMVKSLGENQDLKPMTMQPVEVKVCGGNGGGDGGG